MSAAHPEVISQTEHVLLHEGVAGERVLDLEFGLEQPRFWVGVSRWALFVVLSALVYVGGMMLYASSGTLKDDLMRQGEAGAANLQQGADAFKKLDIEKAMNYFRIAEKNFDTALGLFAELGQSNILLAGVNLPNSQIWQGESLLLSGKHLALAGVQLTDALKPLINYWSGVTAVGGNLQNSGEQIGQILIDNTRKIDAALNEVRLADEALQQISLPSTDPAYVGLVSAAQIKTKDLRAAVEMLGNLAKRLPKALGFDTPQYYLILNQNSNELRPTGGFIGSVVLIEIYHGKIEQVSPDTAQRLDGQNRFSSLELPTPLKAVTAYYGIRDANWEPNFPTSVRTLQKLYQEAGGGSVDGVIALTPGVITDVLSVVGPVAMPQYGFSLDANNFVEKTQKQIEVLDQNKYNPKQVLVDFVPVLMNRLLNANSRELRSIGDKFFQRLVAKDMLIYFGDSQLEQVMTGLNWSGEINPVSSQDDYLYVVDANLGGNKSSSSIVKEMSLQAKVKADATIVDSLELKYTHTGTATFPDGINKNYIRVYVPIGSHITQTTGQDDGTQIDIDSANGKTVVGFWLTTHPGETKVVNLEYELPFKLKFVNSQGNYQLIIQKQSGSDRTVLSSYIEVADNMDLAVKGSSESVRKDMIFSDKLVKDETTTSVIRKYR